METFIELSIIIGITVLIAGITRLLKQPLIIGYILAGVIVGPLFLDIIQSADTLAVFSQIGVTFLLFIVGLSLSPKVIKEVGKVSLVTGIGQIIFTSLIGFFISRLLGFSVIVSLYIAIALTFSSTIIIMKLLSDKRDLERLYGKISIGFLLVQDLFVIILLMIVSSFSGRLSNLENLSMGIVLFGVILIAGLFLTSVYILPRLSRFFAQSQEFLFLFSVGWGLSLAALFHYIGLSMEIGALIAGVALSTSPYNYEISSKMRPLRDFFVILFFIFLGSQMVFSNISQFIGPAIIFSLFILIGNPLIVMVLMGFLGYKKRIGFQAGLTVAQISEFSLIFITLGVAVGHLTNEILSLVTIVGLITIAGSTYLILYSDRIYPYLEKHLSVFERRDVKREINIKKKYDAILFGYNRIGFGILRSLSRIKKNYLVVDFNPDTISGLSKFGIPSLYGDVGDADFLNQLPLDKAQIAISTVPDFETNMLLIESIRSVNPDSIIIVRSHQVKDAIDLYKKGANYVLTPHFLGGEYVSKMLREVKTDRKGYEGEKKKHIDMLREIIERGQEHPEVEKN